MKGGSQSSQGSVSQSAVTAGNASSALSTLAQAHNMANSGQSPGEPVHSSHSLTGSNPADATANTVKHGHNSEGIPNNLSGTLEGVTVKLEPLSTSAFNQAPELNSGSLAVEGQPVDSRTPEGQGQGDQLTGDNTSETTGNGETSGKTPAQCQESVTEATGEGQGVKRKAEDQETPPDKKAK